MLSFLDETSPLTQGAMDRPGICVREALGYTLAFALGVALGGFTSWHIANLPEDEMVSSQARQSSPADDPAQGVSGWPAERQTDEQIFAVRHFVRTTFVEYSHSWGVPILAATQHILLTGWGLVRKVDCAEAPERFWWTPIAEGPGGGILIILLGGLLMVRRREVIARVLKQEEGKFLVLLESAPDVVRIFDPSRLHILGRNRKAAELEAYSNAGIARMTADDLHPSGDHPKVWERFERRLEGAGVLRLHTRLRKDGQRVPVEENQSLVDGGGKRFS
jgi:PAS domain S-box-containing protein